MMRAWMRAVNHLFVGVVAILLQVTAAPAAAAGDYVWRNVKVGGGGFAPAIVFSRVERGLAYLRTDMAVRIAGMPALEVGSRWRTQLQSRVTSALKALRRIRSTQTLSIWPRECIGAPARQSCVRMTVATRGRCFQRPFAWAATKTVGDWVSGWRLIRIRPRRCISDPATTDCNVAWTVAGPGRLLRRFRFVGAGCLRAGG